MSSLNLIKMNDWNIKNFLIFVISVQIFMLGLIFLNHLNIQIPIIRQVIPFSYLFIPGFLILRILNLHKLETIETILYAVGLSLGFLIVTGLLINSLYYILKINSPISANIVILIVLSTFLLCFFSYLRDKNYYNPEKFTFHFTLQSLILILILFLPIFGSYLVNYYQNNILLMLMFLIISLIVILVGLNKFFTKEYYPLIVYVITFALIFHTSLISNYIWGWDINLEYNIAHNVIINGFWNNSLFSNVNAANIRILNTDAVLSISIFAPISYYLFNMNLTWIFKIIYPFIFSLVPLGLYKIFKEQINEEVAFFACILFISLFTFYTEIISVGKQEIAEFFFLLLFIVLLSDLKQIKKSILLIIFGFCLIVSHYTMSYYFIFLVSGLFIIYFILGNQKFNFLKIIKLPLTLNYLIFFIVLALSWYIFISDSSPFISLVQTINQMYHAIINGIFNTSSIQGLGIVTNSTPYLSHELTKYILIGGDIFTGIGLLVIIIKERYNFNKSFLILAGISYVVLLFSLVLPYFSSSINTTRLYQISLIVLSPFAIIGIVYISKFFKIKNYRLILSIFLVIYLLFNSGFVYEIVDQSPSSIALSQNSLNNGNLNEIISFHTGFFTPMEVYGATWLSINRDPNTFVYSSYGDALVLTSYGNVLPNEIEPLYNNTNTNINTNSYLYLGYLGTKYGVVTLDTNQYYFINNSLTNGLNEIYTNGGSNIYSSSN
jgi:uncharacterized membrane protein